MICSTSIARRIENFAQEKLGIMLSAEHRPIVKATIPLLENGGEALSTHFYKIMLDGHPEVRPLFNQAHQASGAQIINMHVALNVLP